uniref:Agrin n=1 Tax=Haemonchus contortus TaxID=6289 RepID=A0A7I4YXN7_HAECO
MSSTYSDAEEAEYSRRQVRKERRDICRTMCTGFLMFTLILAIAAGITIYASTLSKPTYPLAGRERFLPKKLNGDPIDGSQNAALSYDDSNPALAPSEFKQY